MSEPLVSIGIPTFNRAWKLARAAQSALGQTCRNIELIISDNDSSDQTETLCRSLAEADSRIRYFRQRSNIGPVANFDFVRRQAAGRFFMWLSDDDWLDADYVARCAATLAAEPDCTLVAGLPRYYEHDQYVKDDIPLNLFGRSGTRRMLRHYYVVVCCGAFYGLMRHEHARMIALRKVVGCDWLLVGALAFLGRVRTLGNVHIHRQLTGLSRSYAGNARAVSGSNFQARHPHLSTALAAGADVLSSPVYARCGQAGRIALAVAAWATLYLPRTRPAKWLFRLRRRFLGLQRSAAAREAADG